MTNFDELSAFCDGIMIDCLGITASYHTRAGLVSTLKVIVEEITEPSPGDYASNVTETRIQIAMLKSDVPNVRTGEIIKTDDAVYKLLDLVDCDGEEVVYTAKINS